MSIPSTQLALDCSYAGLSLALRTPVQTYSFTTSVPRSSDILPTELDNLFKVSSTGVANLTNILVTVGPGSFTGIRLGLATAEAFKLLNPAITITGLSTLHALALQTVAAHAPAQAFSLLLDAAGGQVYAQNFDAAGRPLSEAVCSGVQQVPNLQPVAFAPASLLLPHRLLPELQAATLFDLAENAAAHMPAQPVYLKPLTYKLA